MSMRSRNYCFTLNNYTDEEILFLEKLKCKYIIYGKETGNEGTPHLQGFVIFNNAKSFTAVKKSLPQRCHYETCKGTPFSNFEYCSKDGNYTERGERPEKVGQGNRTDMIEIKKAVAQNITLKKLLMNDTIVNYQQLKYAEGLTKYYENARNWKTKVTWFYGETGTGKSMKAYDYFLEKYHIDEIYTAMDTAQWWDGYDGQPAVIIDDMRKDFMKFHVLLRLLDRYPYRIQTKGSTRQFVAKEIIITAPYSPQEMYDTREDIQQLLRRIDVIKEFTPGYDNEEIDRYCNYKEDLEYAEAQEKWIEECHPDNEQLKKENLKLKQDIYQKYIKE